MITKRERQKVHAHEWEEIGKDFDKGETLTSIALRFSVSSVTIRNILLGKPRGSVANEKFACS